MEDLNKLSTEALVDLLSTQTSLYIHMHSEGAPEKEFKKCWLFLEAIQKEIRSRNKKNSVKVKD